MTEDAGIDSRLQSGSVVSGDIDNDADLIPESIYPLHALFLRDDSPAVSRR